MQLRPSQIQLLLEEVELPTVLRRRLQSSNRSLSLSLSDSDVAALNELCIARVQEIGLDEDGSVNEIGRSLEEIVDALNAR